MVLNGSGIFEAPIPEVDDDGRMLVDSGGNISAKSIVTGDINSGAIVSMFDDDITSWCGYQINTHGSWTKYITFDFKKLYKHTTILAYYSAYSTSSTAHLTTTWQISKDGTTWTDVDSQSATNSESFKNFSAELADFRYLRFKIALVYTGTTTNGGRIYYLKVSK